MEEELRATTDVGIRIKQEVWELSEQTSSGCKEENYENVDHKNSCEEWIKVETTDGTIQTVHISTNNLESTDGTIQTVHKLESTDGSIQTVNFSTNSAVADFSHSSEHLDQSHDSYKKESPGPDTQTYPKECEGSGGGDHALVKLPLSEEPASCGNVVMMKILFPELREDSYGNDAVMNLPFPALRFHCLYCTATFDSESELKFHKNLHSPPALSPSNFSSKPSLSLETDDPNGAPTNTIILEKSYDHTGKMKILKVKEIVQHHSTNYKKNFSSRPSQLKLRTNSANSMPKTDILPSSQMKTRTIPKVKTAVQQKSLKYKKPILQTGDDTFFCVKCRVTCATHADIISHMDECSPELFCNVRGEHGTETDVQQKSLKYKKPILQTDDDKFFCVKCRVTCATHADIISHMDECSPELFCNVHGDHGTENSTETGTIAAQNQSQQNNWWCSACHKMHVWP